jgi:hypothetical protein
VSIEFTDKNVPERLPANIEVYTHASEGAQRDAVNLLGDQLFPNVPKLEDSGNTAQEKPQLLQ